MARSWWGSVAVVAGLLIAAAAVAGPAAAATPGAGTSTTTSSTSRAGAGDDPCGLLSAAAVESALGIVDPDTPGPYGSTTNQCFYGQPLGLHFRITVNATGDGGKLAKETCARAKDGTALYADYARIRGVGKLACSYTMNGDPTVLVVALHPGSKSVGRALTLAVSGTPAELAPIEPRIASGLQTLAEQAAAAVKRETD